MVAKSGTAVVDLCDVATKRQRHLRSAIAYSLIFGITVIGFLLVRSRGRDLTAPSPASTFRFGSGAAPVQLEVLLHVLLALTVIILFAMPVIMALATTLMTAPILHLLVGSQFTYNKEAKSV